MAPIDIWLKIKGKTHLSNKTAVLWGKNEEMLNKIVASGRKFYDILISGSTTYGL
jgi:hypothetical protein